MKTILKRKLLKTGIFVSRFLILVIPGTLTSQHKRVDYLAETIGPYVSFPFASKVDTLINKDSSDSSATFTSSSAEANAALAFRPNHYVSNLIEGYLKKEGEFLSKIKERSGPYFSTIEKVFDKCNLPIELKYLAVVESNLKRKATSYTGAKGIWQLMPETARDYGLKVSHNNDERTNLYKSTVAAAKYLKGLYAEFDDWLLVIAAYNGGTGAIRKAIKKSGSHDYWRLRPYLPAETNAHVKHYIATHYFFEGQGGITTVTKAQRIAYLKGVEKYKNTQNKDTLVARFSNQTDSSSKKNQPVDSTNYSVASVAYLNKFLLVF